MPSTEQPKRPNSTQVAAVIAAATLIVLPLTAHFEGTVNHPYLDPVGIPTVCTGETHVEMRVYSNDECAAMLRRSMMKTYVPQLNKCLPELALGGWANAFAAFLDASYNAGARAVCVSPMAKKVHNGALRAACEGFSGWYVTARGKKLPGLVRRREAEKNLCLKDLGVYK